MSWEITEHNYLGFDINGKTSGKIRCVCPLCSSQRKPEHQKDKCAYVDIDKEYYFCHNCGETGRIHKYKKTGSRNEDTMADINYDYGFVELPDKVYEYFSGRGISKETLKKAKVQYDKNIYIPQEQKECSVIAFTYYNMGCLVNKKYRTGNKKWAMIKGQEKPFYNIDSILFTDTVIIQEGEIDVLSSIECGLYNCVSPPNGANDTSMKWLNDTYESHFKEKVKIILAGDNDVSGKELHERLASRLGKHRCLVVDWLDCKDGNAYLVKYGKEKYVEQVNNATPYPVAGVFRLNSSIEEQLFEERENGTQKGVNCHIETLSPHFSWLKKDVIVFGGYSNMGKSEFFYFACMLMAVHEGWKTIIAAFEDKTSDRFYRKLIEMYSAKKLDPKSVAYNNHITKTQLKEAIEFVREHFIYIKPNEKFTRKATLDAISNAIAMYGADIVCIDPLNKLVKDKTHLRDDEYLIDYYVEQEQFASNHNVCACSITHTNKPMINKDGTISPPNRFTILGGQAASNAVDEIIFVHKSNPDWDSKDRDIIVDKVRDRDLVGVPGVATLSFNYHKRRYCENINGQIIDPLTKSSVRTSVIQNNTDFDTDVPF